MEISLAAPGILAVVFRLVPGLVHRVAAYRMVERKSLAGIMEGLAARFEYGRLPDDSAIAFVVCRYGDGAESAGCLYPLDYRI